jgi:gluconate 2-dehydrogenase gamma chain
MAGDERGRLQRGFTRRSFLATTAKAGAVAAAVSVLPVSALASKDAHTATAAGFTDGQRSTLRAAVARIVPAETPGDWSAADAGAVDYIEQLLFGPADIYAGGPYREEFAEFQPLSRVKQMGWADEIARLRAVYADGVATLDQRAGGDFAAAPTPVQDAILQEMDFEGTPFFASLFAHTMEGVYSHPVYGGNKDYIGWDYVCYQGDVHGVRRPAQPGPWNTYGGYAPDEMSQPGSCAQEDGS